MRQTQQTRPVKPRHMKLSTLVTLMVAAVMMSVLLSIHLLYFVQIDDFTRAHLKDKALAVARTLAENPQVQHGLTLPATSNIIQPLATSVRIRNDLLFITIINMEGIRYSHPNPQLINQHFIGSDFLPALQGHENVAINRGALADALRVFTPIFNAQHKQIGVVGIGIALNDVSAQVAKSRWNIVWTVLIGALVGGLGILILVTRLKRILLGLEPYEISSLFEQRQAILDSVREGVIAVDEHARVTLINQAARELLPESAIHALLNGEKNSETAVMLAGLLDTLHHGNAHYDEELHVRERIMIGNTVPVRSHQRIIGAVFTFRDKTEINRLMQRLDGMVNYVDALRERSHEFMNKLHVILGLLHIKHYSRLEEYVLQTANNYQTEIGSLLQKIKSPVIAGFLLSKINRASDMAHRLTISDASDLPDYGSEQQVAVLVTVLGNLIENALEAFDEHNGGDIHVLLHYQNGWLTCEVGDDGPGIPTPMLETLFDRGVSSKGEQRGMGLFLARQQTEGLGGRISVESEPGVYTQFLVQIPWNKGNITA
ncbi:sensor histidine kinase [Erwinia sp. V71]|uniref:sensor histidine kinase n=1 Tax=Erwinia sp. V71 TaxID=3369424 RepID=UPI003F611C2B